MYFYIQLRFDLLCVDYLFHDQSKLSASITDCTECDCINLKCNVQQIDRPSATIFSLGRREVIFFSSDKKKRITNKIILFFLVNSSSKD